MTTEHIKTPWKVMSCPEHQGKHEYHDNRWIATEDAEVEIIGYGEEPEWRMTRGHLIAKMRDIHPAYARLISAAPELLAACKATLAAMEDPDFDEYMGAAQLTSQLREAIDKATVSPRMD